MDTSAKAHVFVSDLDAPGLTPADDHHLRRVLRLHPGDVVTAGDGAGRWRRCRLGVGLEAVSDIETEARPDPELTVAFALVKGERPEWVVQKLTELGIDRIVPFVAARSVVRWDDRKIAHNHDRFVTVARLAAMQSRRPWLPVVEDVRDFAAIAARQGVALADGGGSPPSLAHPIVAVGPEGGWSEAERARRLPAVRLADTVLRAETAAIVAGSMLAALRIGLVCEGTTAPGD